MATIVSEKVAASQEHSVTSLLKDELVPVDESGGFRKICFSVGHPLGLCRAVMLVTAVLFTSFLFTSFLFSSGVAHAQDKDIGVIDPKSALYRGSEIRLIKQTELIENLRMSVDLKDEQITRLNARIAALDTIVGKSKSDKSQDQNRALIEQLSEENSQCDIALKSRTELLEKLQIDLLSTEDVLEDRNAELDKVTFELQKVNNMNGILSEKNQNGLISIDALNAKVATLESDSRHFIAEGRKISGLLEKCGLDREELEILLVNLNSEEMPDKNPVTSTNTLKIETQTSHVGGSWYVRYTNTGPADHLSLEEASDMDLSLPDLADCSLFVEGFESNPALSDVLVVNGFRVNKIWVRIDSNRLGLCTVLRSESGKFRARFSKQKPSRVDKALVLMKKN